MGYGKMNTNIDIITTEPTKDAEGFVTKGDPTPFTLLNKIETYPNRPPIIDRKLRLTFSLISGIRWPNPIASFGKLGSKFHHCFDGSDNIAIIATKQMCQSLS